MKKIISFVMVTAMVMSMTSATAFAAPGRARGSRSSRRAVQTVCTGIRRNAKNYLKNSGARGTGRGIGLRDGSCFTR